MPAVEAASRLSFPYPKRHILMDSKRSRLTFELSERARTLLDEISLNARPSRAEIMSYVR